MMDHLLDALEQRRDIGHYGRLVFTMIARHFLSEDELLDCLERNPDFSREQAVALLKQVEARGYNPPRRERILEWQKQQEFPICLDPQDPSQCNAYRNLDFPQDVYRKIAEFYESQQ